MFYLYYLKDRIIQRDVIQAEIARLELSVAQGTAIENQLKRFKQELAQLEERLAVLRSILPSEKETPAVLRSVQKMAADRDRSGGKLRRLGIVFRKNQPGDQDHRRGRYFDYRDG